MIRDAILAELQDLADSIEKRESKPDKTDRESLLIMYAQVSAISALAERLGYSAGLKYFSMSKVCKIWCTMIA